MSSPTTELVIMLGGPLHRRVYRADAVPAKVPYRDSGRWSKAPLGAIHHNCDTAWRELVPKVWDYLGDDDKPIAAPVPGARGFGHSCTFLGCLAPAVYRIGGDLERKPWFGCEEHKPGMVAALAIGRPSGYSVDPVPC